MLKSVLVKGMCTCLSLDFPCFIILRRDERITDDVLEEEIAVSLLVRDRILADEDVLNYFWIRNP